MKRPSAAAQKRARDYEAALKRNTERIKRDMKRSQEALDKHRLRELDKPKR